MIFRQQIVNNICLIVRNALTLSKTNPHRGAFIMNYPYSILIFLSMLLLPVSLSAQHRFIENKNQFPDQVEFKCRLNYGALFLEKDGLVYNFADKSQYQHSHAHHGESDVTEAHHEHDNDLPDALDFHAYKVKFINPSGDMAIRGLEKCPDYENYFIGNDRSTWASNVGKYEKMRYSGVWEGIDLEFYDVGQGLKYDFIIQPGADPGKIIFEFEGVDKVRIRQGNLMIKTSLAKTTEMQPYAYQIIDGDTVEVACEYSLDKKLLTYVFPDGYHEGHELVIDPTLVFSTYTGSTADNWGFTATWDYNDNVYSGGIVFDVGYPTTLGAYQTDMAGGTAPFPGSSYYAQGCDVGIIKYNEDGTERLFATYLGGAVAEEMPHSMVVNQNNELIIFGTTGSSDFPLGTNAFDDTFNGGDSIMYDNVIVFPDGTDIFLTKLSEDGSQLLGSTYLGGSKNDGLNFKLSYTEEGYIQMHGNDSLYYNYGDGARGEVIADDKDYIHVGANTFSTDIAPGINPGFQTSNGGGMDGLVAKFSPDLSSMVWMSYLGGSADDAIYSIYPDGSNNVLVCGGTSSTDFPSDSDAVEPYYLGGSTDAFVAKINHNGNALLGSTYFGTSEYDQAHFVRIDENEDVYIYGQTEATGNSLIYNAGYSVPNSGQFLAKFNGELSSLEWSTVFGRGAGRPVLSPSAFAVDVCDRIYLAGWGREWSNTYLNAAGDIYAWTDDYGTKGLPVTANAIQTETDGQDFYVAVFSEDAATLEYASFFGEVHYPGCGYSGHDHVDGGTSRFDNKGNIIQSVCASCGGCQEFPTMPVPGVWSPTNASTNCNNAVFKINIIENLAASSFEPVPAICAPVEVQFVNNSQGSSFLWDFGDGSPTSTEFEPEHTFTQEGVFEVMLIAFDSVACNYADTSYRFVEVQTSDVMTLDPITICPGESVQIGPEESYDDDVDFFWTQGDVSDTDIQNPVVSPEEDTEYVLAVNDICTDTIYQDVLIQDFEILLSMPPDTMICEGDPVSLAAATGGDVSGLVWSDDPGFSNVISTTENMSDTPDGTTTYYLEVTESICNTTTVETVLVEWHQFNYEISPDAVICEGDSLELFANNLNPADNISYQWGPLSGIDNGAETDSPLVSPASDQTYTLTLTNQMGCTTSDQVQLTIDDLSFLPPQVQEPLCYGDCTGSVSVDASGYPPYSFSWDDGSNGESNDDLCAGNYSLTVTDDIGCEDVTSIEINQPELLEAQFVSVAQPECDGIGLGEAEVSASGGTGSYSYQWSDGSTDALNDHMYTGINYVTITDANDCDTVIDIEMIPPNNLATSLENVEHNPCYGDCQGEISLNVSGGTAPYEYNWNDGLSGPAISDLCAGLYQVTIIDADNCVVHRNVAIHEPDTLIAQIQPESPIACYGETTGLDIIVDGGTYPYYYNWDNGTDQPSLDSLPAGTYLATVTDINNCTDTVEYQLAQPPELVYSETVHNMLCEGVCNGSIVINPGGGTPPYQFQWNNTSGDSVAEDLCSGSYEMLLEDDNGCRKFGEFQVISENYVPPLEAEADPPEIFHGTATNLHATNEPAYHYNWTPEASLSDNDSPDVTAYPEETTTYEVRIVDSNGCVNKDTVIVIVNELVCGEPYLYIPNAFTPNGDGENDYFKPYAPVGIVKKMYFAVYDRWGELIYESDNINDKGWDGTFRGKQLTPDVYVYFFEATCIDKDTFTKKGNVTLIR